MDIQAARVLRPRHCEAAKPTWQARTWGSLACFAHVRNDERDGGPPNEKRRPGGRRFHGQQRRGSEPQPRVFVLEPRHATARIHELGAATRPGRMRQWVDVKRERLALVAPGG